MTIPTPVTVKAEPTVMQSFADACEPLVKWFNDNPQWVTPHTTAIITYSSAELVHAQGRVLFNELVKD